MSRNEFARLKTEQKIILLLRRDVLAGINDTLTVTQLYGLDDGYAEMTLNRVSGTVTNVRPLPHTDDLLPYLEAIRPDQLFAGKSDNA